MLKIIKLLRLIHIAWVLVRHGLDDIVLATHLFRPIRFLRIFTPWFWIGRRNNRTRGERIRRALEDLGPIYVKFGQMLSTRRDLLPDDIAEALSRLQDQVRPFSGEEARTIIEKAYGKSVDEVFDQFDITPLASASIAQVHAATLKNGTPVVVKVVRPNIARYIRRDLNLLYIFAELAERYWSEGKRLHPVEVVREFDKTLMDELDLQREAANATQLRRNFAGSDLLYVPEIYWDYIRRNVLVMERIEGIPVNHLQTLKQQGTDMKKLAERGVEIFFTQVFRHNFFHADMHPGNIFVSRTNPRNPMYMAVDFGIVGTLTPSDQRYLAENLHAFFQRDYKRVAELHVESGWVPRDTNVADFEAAIRTVCEPIFNRPLREISFGHFLLRLFQTARRFNMEVQPQLVLLQKTLLNIEGLGRELYPELDLWTTAKPFLEKWTREHLGWQAFAKGMKEQLPGLMEKLPQFPSLAYEALRHMASAPAGDGSRQQLEELRQQLQEQHRRQSQIIVGASLLVCSALVQQGSLLPANWQLGVVAGTLGFGLLLIVSSLWRNR